MGHAQPNSVKLLAIRDLRGIPREGGLVLPFYKSVLDWLLIWGENHLRRVLHTYCDSFNAQRPHPGLNLRVLVPVVRLVLSPTRAG